MHAIGSRLVRRCVLWLLLAIVTGCGDDGEPVPPTPTPVPTATGVPTATLRPTLEPSATETMPPAATSSPTAIPTSTEPPPTPTPTPTTTATVPPTPTFEPGTCQDPEVRETEPLCELDDAEVPCDFLIPEKCLLPYPSSFFLAPDESTGTGFHVEYPIGGMPANIGGVPIDPSEFRTLDGFSPGPIIEALFPQGVDLEASAVAPITDFARSLEEDSPTVIVDATSGERVLHFTELDVQATSHATSALLIRPGVRLREGRRYVVAIRGLIDLDGNPIEARRGFRVLRDGIDTPVEAVEARRAHFEEIFSILESAGVARQGLLLAWDFVVASTESLTRRALAIRDRGLEANGPGAPPFEVTSVEDDFSEHIFRRVEGTFTVPLFVDSPTPPARLNLDEEGLPFQNGTMQAHFLVIIPRVAVEGEAPLPGRPIVYGHGLLGSRREVRTSHLRRFADRFNFVMAATDWIGMSEEDVDPTIEMITDLSQFPRLPDRIQQAFLNFILLGRLMIAPDGFNSHPAFQFDGVGIIDPQELYYYGISQGGIQGGAYLALSPDTTRGVLGVGASNYSTLLRRSVDFNQFLFILNQVYTDELDRALIYPLLQQLWDRGEPNGYLSHIIADPLPGTPAKKVLLQPGLYDSQVPMIGTEIQVRSMGIPNIAPTVWPLFGVPEMEAPFDGSALAPYDVNGTTVPLTNTAPVTDNGVHEAVRRLEESRLQIDAFLRPDGRIENFCDGPCFFTGVPDVDER